MKRATLKGMSGDAIGMVPVDYDWTAHPVGEDSAWGYTEATRCEKCGEPVLNSPGDQHDAIDNNDGDLVRCAGHVPTAEGPMMNYFYPCDIRDEHEAAKVLVDTCLCVVNIDGKTGLALTGGGMDLSWEICEAFMMLGFLPPLHFADLPSMAGRGTSDRDRWIVSGCLKTCAVAAKRARWTSRRLRETIKHAQERMLKSA